MKPTLSAPKPTRFLSYIVAVILLLMPFHAVLTVWASSLAGHYTVLRLWKEFLLVPLVVGSLVLVFKDKALRQGYFKSPLTWLIKAYAILLLLNAAIVWHNHNVTHKAILYGLLVDLRFLVFFLVVRVVASKSGWLKQNWPKILFWPAALVAGFAVLQYLILPYDFLKHFGYGPSTIGPYETINHNINHLRVMSTLRGANPLGAYLILPLSALAVWPKKRRAGWYRYGFGSGLLAALLFSFSRSAWLGAAVSLVIAAELLIKSRRLRQKLLLASVGLLIVVGLVGLSLRNNPTFQDTILHTDNQSSSPESSNQGHAKALKKAASEVWHQPLGGGVGSAGPQSVYNHPPARIAENYYLQIGQEAGLLGMALFIAICVWLGRDLYKLRAEPLALAMLASLVGLVVVNLLSHAWEDDTLSYVFWGLAGVAAAPAIIKRKHNEQSPKP